MQRLAPGLHLTSTMAKPSLPTVVAADSLAVLTSLQASMRDIRSQLPTGRGAPARLGRQLDAQAAALGARAHMLSSAAPTEPPSARAAPVPVDSRGPARHAVLAREPPAPRRRRAGPRPRLEGRGGARARPDRAGQLRRRAGAGVNGGAWRRARGPS
jgi:hypothetical protein